MRTQTLRIRAIFRPDDPDAPIVLAFVTAANDLGILFRMMFAFLQTGDERPFRKALDDAVRHYVSRMGTIHLPDLWGLINSGDFRRVERRLSRRVPEIRELAEKFKAAVNRGPLRYVVAGVRNSFAGHPSQEAVQRALSLVDPSALMDVPISTDGLGDHYNVTDLLFGAVLVEDSHVKYKRVDAEDSTKALLNELIDAQLALRNLAGALFAGLYFDMIRSRPA